MADLKPCTSIEAFEAKERRNSGGEFLKECDHQSGEPHAKTQGERQPNPENLASLYQFKLGKEKARERQDNETLENNSTTH